MTDSQNDELDRLLSRSARALRDEVDGQTGDAADTRARILATKDQSASRSMWAMAAAIVLAVGLGGSTAWAWWTGRLETLIGGANVPSMQHAEPRSKRAKPPEIETPPAENAIPVTSIATSANVERESIPTVLEPQRVRPAVENVPMLPESLAQGLSEQQPVDPVERRAYDVAHALHFIQRSSDRAIGAWDAYLSAYPNGRFALEASYNRAICLVRLGRTQEARSALEPFATGARGGYRQREAAALIEALQGPTPTQPEAPK